MKTILENWTPAQLLVLQNEKNISNNRLIKFTFFDLVLKDVLRIVSIQKSPNKRDKPRSYKYVTIGKQFYFYKYQVHEAIFLEPFTKNQELQILFTNLVKSVVKTFKNDKWFHQNLINQTELSKYFNIRSYGFWWFKGYVVQLNPSGEVLQGEIKLALEKEKERVERILELKSDHLITHIKQLKGAFFLIPELDYENVEQLLSTHFKLDKETLEAFYILRSLKEHTNDYNNSSGACSGCSSFVGIDNGCSNDSSSGHGGCSSDGSGDSGGDSGGCSGCGGGCGGGD
jgi:uncharacterized membrane protein YgcG